MKRLSNMSIRMKQIFLIVLTSSIALLLACSAFVANEVISFRRDLAEEVTVLADAVGLNCSAALDFSDARSAEETLGALRANENVIGATVYTSEGVVFAKYHRDDDFVEAMPLKPEEGYSYDANRLSLFRPIMLEGSVIGTIFVSSDLKELPQRLIRYLGIVVLVLIISLFIVVVISSRLERLVSEPILRLVHVAREVAENKDYGLRVEKQSNDEIGQLIEGFNEMLTQIQFRDSALREARDHLEARVEERTRELAETHRKLLDVSRQAGMAEVATNVLHNVGNVLNSLNVSVTLITDSVKTSKVVNLSKVVSLLEAHADDLETFFTKDPKGLKIPMYLERLSENLLKERSTILLELESLKTNTNHINDIVGMQQSYARVSGLLEFVNLNDLIEDSLQMNIDSLVKYDIRVIKELEKVPQVNVERHKVLQILNNLISNARHACVEASILDKYIKIKSSSSERSVMIVFEDNGVGILAENLTRIFNHGFTTRSDGHGFGLHSGALAAKEMKGELLVESDGLGKGARFTLKLPRNDE